MTKIVSMITSKMTAIIMGMSSLELEEEEELLFWLQKAKVVE